MKTKLFLLSIALLMASCYQNEPNVELYEYSNADSSIVCGIPSYMNKMKEDSYSMSFSGDDKLVNIMFSATGESWEMEKYAHHLIGENIVNLTLVEHNDSMMVYEIQNGMATLHAFTFSQFSCGGKSILVTTMGIDKDTHLAIKNSIRCQ